MMSRLAAPTLAGVLAAAACAQTADGPVGVADRFAEAYFQQANQEKAKNYTALGASFTLDDEIARVAPLRAEHGPADSRARVRLKRGAAMPRDQRIRVPYEVSVLVDSTETIRDADVELARIDGEWKVVRFALTSREDRASHEQ